jgi:protein-L-isoaspartate(D-aspartate) O-methyltransferase
VTGFDWAAYARRMADDLRKRGDVTSPAWHAALAEVPRHVFVPSAYEQVKGGVWVAFDTAGMPERVYSAETLVTMLARADEHQVPVSSSTKPDLMVRMLEILDVSAGQRVLEIGTGTGYNAALLSHRLGDANVFSVDVTAELVRLARERLAALGYRPTLVAVDGEDGLPGHAPYDRIIATCSVPEVPWAWAEQLSPGGTVLVDLKLGIGAGNLVHLRREPDRLEGRFTKRWAGFMAMRHSGSSFAVPLAEKAAGSRRRVRTTPADPWNVAPIAWFLAQIDLPRGVVNGFEFDAETGRPTAMTLSARDGSWARIGVGDDHDVTESGPTSLWEHTESAYERWLTLGSPSWDRFGLTVLPDGFHRLWLDDPDGEFRWSLPRR